MRIATWNVNSIRQRIEPVMAWLKETQPDIACLQEIKCTDDAFPRLEFESLGFNVIPTADDVYNPPAWVNDALFRTTTRESFQALLGLGLTDALRAVNDAPGQYTFWDYQAGAWQKNQGLRIDHLLLSPQASDRLVDVGIDSYLRGWEKPSDHVPVWADFDFETV